MIRPDGTPHSGAMDGWEADGCPLSIAVVSRVQSREWDKKLTMPWGKLILDHRVVASKSDAPLWSPVVVSSLARRLESVTAVSALVYDFDNGTKWEDVVDVLEVFGIRFWSYTTFSHTEDHHKFRVVLGLDEAIPANLFRQVWTAYRSFMGWTVDEACKDASHLYYVPSCPSVSPSPWQNWGGSITVDWRAIIEADNAQKARNVASPAHMHVVAMRRQEERFERRDKALAETVRRCFDTIDPDIHYHSWLYFGMAAQDAGLEDEWIQWCSRGRKYVKGEPEKKLRSFRR